MRTDTAATHPSHLELPDGRRLAYAELGDPRGKPALYCHGFPSSHREARLLEPAARTMGVRLITLDRPGYGASDVLRGRTIPTWAADCAFVLDRLGHERVGLIGVSGGGPFALACATAMPERLDACTLICPLGPIYEAEVLAAMPGPARVALGLVRRAPLLSGLVYGPPVSHLLARWPVLVEQIRDGAAPRIDRTLLAEPRTRGIMNSSLRDALSRGAIGARQDIRLYTQPWGLSFAAIRTPIDLWHGDIDGTVPVAHAHWYAQHLQDCTSHILPGEGHFSLPLRHGEAILGQLVDRGQRQTAALQTSRDQGREHN